MKNLKIKQTNWFGMIILLLILLSGIIAIVSVIFFIILFPFSFIGLILSMAGLWDYSVLEFLKLIANLYIQDIISLSVSYFFFVLLSTIVSWIE